MRPVKQEIQFFHDQLCNFWPHKENVTRLYRQTSDDIRNEVSWMLVNEVVVHIINIPENIQEELKGR